MTAADLQAANDRARDRIAATIRRWVPDVRAQVALVEAGDAWLRGAPDAKRRVDQATRLVASCQARAALSAPAVRPHEHRPRSRARRAVRASRAGPDDPAEPDPPGDRPRGGGRS